jgi:glutaredoxin 3
MQSPEPQTLPWVAHMNSTATVNRGPDQITRQLMPPPSHIPFEDSTGKEGTAYPSKSGNNNSELIGRNTVSYNSAEVWDSLEKVASENAVVMFSMSSCCVCHVVKRLFSSLGVAPAVYELDQVAAGHEIAVALQKLSRSSQALPAIFIGKKCIGGLEELIAAHIGGSLVPQLKLAGAL